MAPVEDSLTMATLSSPLGFPPIKEHWRVGGEGGPLGVGRCSTSLYKDILVNPKPSPSVTAPWFVDKSVSCLLEHCLGWEQEEQVEEQEEVAGELLLACSPLSLPTLLRLVEEGCDPYQSTSRGRTALHLLLGSSPPPSPHLLLPATSLLLEVGASLEMRDSTGATPLLTISKLLEGKQFTVAASLATLLLSSPLCDVNSMDSMGRTLLSYSVSYLDSSSELTRVLVNHGAKVWPTTMPTNPSVEEVVQDKEQSAFTWFLRAVIRQRNLDTTDATLNCLNHVMGKAPRRMKEHVIRIMVSEGRYPRVLGPVFLQLKLAMEPFWCEPPALRYLAWRSVRRSLGPRRLERGALQLGLPRPIATYLTLARASRPTFK